MNDKQRSKISKFLSLILRHEPERAGLTLDSAGWVDIETLLAAVTQHHSPLSREQLEEVVATSDKKRFAFSEDGTQIRASQGHSVEVSLDYAPQVPPPRLFHGTPSQFLPSIRATGLDKRERHHVHLSPDRETARMVGLRRGTPEILVVKAAEMQSSGHLFYLSANGVWLTDRVPPEYIEFPEFSSETTPQ